MGLQFGLDFPLPEAVHVGDGTALFLCGWCFPQHGNLSSLSIVVDGEEQPASAWGMPRREVMGAVGGEGAAGYRSGFWGIARVGPGPVGEEIAIDLLADGERVALARVRRAELEAPIVTAAPARVAICMATHEPPLDLFRRQVESIRAQTVDDWVCVISDDASRPERLEAIRAIVADDPRFHLTRAGARLGFYRNFERALALAPADAPYVAMADQDDYWHPDKLETLLDAIGDAQLVYSDARIVDRGGEVVSETYWPERRNNHTDLFSLLSANSVTGAASLLRHDLLRYALPFPPAQFGHYHDHWVALTALSVGDIAYVDRPLYDYTQHGSAVLGHSSANTMPTMGDRVRGLRRPLRERIGLWRLTYYAEACRLMQVASVLEIRCAPAMSRTKRAALGRFMRADRSPLALGRFAARATRELVGRPETLGAELGLFFGFGWRHAGGGGEPRAHRARAAAPDRRPAPAAAPVGAQGPRARAAGRARPRVEGRAARRSRSAPARRAASTC